MQPPENRLRPTFRKRLSQAVVTTTLKQFQICKFSYLVTCEAWMRVDSPFHSVTLWPLNWFHTCEVHLFTFREHLVATHTSSTSRVIMFSSCLKSIKNRRVNSKFTFLRVLLKMYLYNFSYFFPAFHSNKSLSGIELPKKQSHYYSAKYNQ